MQSRAIVVNFRQYTPFGHEFYEPIFDFFVHNLYAKGYEYDHVYFLDSQWDFTDNDYEKMKTIKGGIIKVDPSLRYYDAYKSVLPQIKEDLVLLTDNDMIVYKTGVFRRAFTFLLPVESVPNYDVISIYDTIGKNKFYQLNDQSKFCPYWFGAKKEVLMKYLDVDWGPNMPEYETLGKLTEEMLKNNVLSYEFEEDKTGILFDGTYQYPDTTAILNKDGNYKSKDLGYYHIRAGSTPAYLLATKKYGNIDTYNEYIKNQPKQEFLRQYFWYWHMCKVTGNMELDLMPLLDDVGISLEDWNKYYDKCIKYYGLE